MRALLRRPRQPQPTRQPSQPETVVLGLRIVYRQRVFEWDLCAVNWLEEVYLFQTVDHEEILLALELNRATVWINLCESPDDASPRATWYTPLRANDWRAAKVFKQPPHDAAHCRLRILRIDRPRA